MATSTVGSFLMHKASGETDYEKLICIKDYPDMGGTPSALEATTLCDHQQVFVEGVKSGEQLEFTANYSKTGYSAIRDLAGGVEQFALWFGEDSSGDPDGHEGKFTFSGTVSVRLSGKGVDEVREMVIVITPTTEISFL